MSNIVSYDEVTHADELLATLLKGGNILFIPMDGGWTATAVGSGGTYTYGASWHRVITGATANSSEILIQSIYGFNPGGTNQAKHNWDKKGYYIFNYTRETSDAEAVARVQFKEVSTIGALGAKGIGIRADNFALTGESYGTALGEVDLGTTLVTNVDKQIVIIHDPSVPKIEWYVDEVLKGTQSTAAKIPSGLSGDVFYIAHSIANGVTGGVDAYSYLINPRIWQAR